MADRLARAHLNLVESSRRLFELDPAAELEATDGWLFGAGGLDHPVIANVAMRIDDEVEASELLARARDFFGARGRGFTLWIRDGTGADDGLAGAAEALGMKHVYEMPEMLLGERPEQPSLPAGAELHRVETHEELLAYWRVASSAYVSLGFPPEHFEANRRSEVLLDDPSAAAFRIDLDGEPVSVAMTIATHGVAGIYWVGSLEQARGRGLGRAVTTAATNAGFDLGAEVASLQASPMGRPIYEAMGYETAWDYRLLLSPAP